MDEPPPLRYLWKSFTREKYMEFSKPNAREVASGVIQRAWRSWTNTRIYRLVHWGVVVVVVGD